MVDSHEYIESLDDVKIGKNVLESLTRSAYDDCRCILREYVQNAADQIDIAREQKLSENDNYSIYVNIYPEEKRIEIEDDATGVAEAEVLPVLRNVACSQKDRVKRKGFRGIGRLGGLGYCSTLTFVTSFKGECVKSILRWNAAEMTRIIDDQEDESSAGNVVSKVTDFYTEKEKSEAHYFKIIMEEVSDQRLLNVSDIRDYLSMVAPVEFSNNFVPFKNDIKQYMKEHGLSLDTYDVYVNSEQIYKQYTRSILDKYGNKIDEVDHVECYIKEDNAGNPFYWGWYSICKLEGILDPTNIARGIRLRCKNIQLGNESNCRRFLPGKQEERFNDYFFGEIHTLSDNLIPDMDRNYLRVDDARTEFETKVREDFVVLKKYCNEASEIRSASNKVKIAAQKGQQLQEKKKNKSFSSPEELKRREEDFQNSQIEAQRAIEKLKKRKEAMERSNSPLANCLIKSYIVSEPEQGYSQNENAQNEEGQTQEFQNTYLRTSKPIYSKFNRQTINVINVVYEVIGNLLPEENMKEALISKIETEITK